MPTTDDRKIYDVELLYECGGRPSSRTVRLLAEDTDSAERYARYYRKNYETIGTAKEVEDE